MRWREESKIFTISSKKKKDSLPSPTPTKPRITDTRLIQTVFFVPVPGQSPYISSKFNLLTKDTR